MLVFNDKLDDTLKPYVQLGTFHAFYTHDTNLSRVNIAWSQLFYEYWISNNWLSPNSFHLQ